MQKKGVFISFEGGEGTGKSTQMEILADVLRSSGIGVVTTCNPQKGGEFRKILVASKTIFTPEAEAEMFFKDREDQLEKVIAPAVEKGQWVISDRFADSSRAYQGYGRGLDSKIVEELNIKHVGDVNPDFTIVFDVDPKIGLERSLKENIAAGTTDEEKFEKLGLEFHQRIRAGYLDIVKKFPERCVLIDATPSLEEVTASMIDVIEKRFDVDLKKTDKKVA